jgi:hypothetical protein
VPSHSARASSSDPTDADLYQLLDELDRLEELLEDMADLGVTSVADVERRIAELNAEVDARSGDHR